VELATVLDDVVGEFVICVELLEELDVVIGAVTVLDVEPADVVWEVVEVLDEESKAYPPTPAAITITTIAMTAETVLLIACFFLKIIPTTVLLTIQIGELSVI